MIRRAGLSKLLVEPPTVATGDIAFNLVVFFLVCASVTPDTGRRLDIPNSESREDEKQQSQNIEVALTRTTAMINGDPVKEADFLPRLTRLLAEKRREEDRVVVVKSSKDTSYQQWVKYTLAIEQAGGIITLQMEEEQTVVAP
jgi:biopolymer transport protein ExbD